MRKNINSFLEVLLMSFDLIFKGPGYKFEIAIEIRRKWLGNIQGCWNIRFKSNLVAEKVRFYFSEIAEVW